MPDPPSHPDTSPQQDLVQKVSTTDASARGVSTPSVETRNISTGLFSRKAQWGGIIFKILSGVFLSLMVISIKAVGSRIPLGEIVFFRSFFAIIPLVIFTIVRGEFPRGFRTKNISGHGLRCLFGCSAMFTSFATLRYLPVAEATVISYFTPILVVILSIMVLHEPGGGSRWSGVLLGVMGVMVVMINKFTVSVDEQTIIGVTLGILSALLTSGAYIQIRRLSQTEHPAALAFYFVLVSSILGLATMPLAWEWHPTLADLSLLILSGLFGGVAHIFLNIAYSKVHATTLAPFEYLTFIWIVVAGVVVFDEIPSIALAVGGPLILAGAFIAGLAKQKHVTNKS